MKYVLPQKAINYCISRCYEVAEVWTKHHCNNIVFVKLVPKQESLEMRNCWKAMGFTNSGLETYVTSFSTPETILGQVGLINDGQWNEVYETIRGNKRNLVTGHWKGKPHFVKANDDWLRRDVVKEWRARVKDGRQKKWRQFDDLQSLCNYYHLNHNFISKQFNHLDTFCTNSGILIKKTAE